jgi:hypothetical protein
MTNRITTFFSFKEEGSGLKKIKADIQGVDGAWNKVKVGFKSSITEFRNSNTAQAAAVGALGAAAVKAIGYASDLNESVNAVKVTFGEAADEVLAIGENSAESFGLAKSEFNGFAVQFSSFAQKVAAEDGRDVADVIEELMTRVSDFASVMNLDVPRAAEVFQSALSGETEPIKKFGKDLSAAAVEQYALANGLIETKSELTETIKVTARYGLLMEQTADTAGDFANTSDELANSQRVAAAKAKDLAAEFGEKLAPAMEGLVQGGLALIDVIEAIHLDDLLGVMNDFDDLGLSIGRNLRHIFDGGGAHRNRQLVESVDGAAKAAADFDMELVKNAKSIAEARDIASEYTDGLDDNINKTHALNLIGLKWNDTIGAQIEETRRAAEVSSAMSYALELEAKGAEVATRQAEEKARADREAEINSRAHADAIDEQRRSTEELIAQNLRLIGGDIAVRQAQRDAREAADELTEALDDQNLTLDEAGEVIDEAALKQLNAARAAADYRKEQIEANGAVVTAQREQALLRDELSNLAAEMEDGPLKAAIQAMIDDLDRLTRDRTINIGITGPGVGRVGGAGVFARHTGGRVTPGDVVQPLSGEGFVADTPGRVVSREDMAGRGVQQQRQAPIVQIEHFHAEDRADVDALASAINARMRI